MLQVGAGWSRWLLREPESESGPLLFVLPHPGCGAETYRRWPRTIGPWEICPVQLPGSEALGRYSRAERYRALSEELSAEIEQYRSRSVGVFGHRESALLAYGTGIALARAGDQEPPWTFVSAHTPPGAAQPPATHDRTDAALAEVMCRVMLEMGGNPLPSLVENQVRSWREDVLAAAAYQPGPPEPSRLRLITLSWSEDDDVTPGAMAGWRELGRTTAHVLPGDQYGFLSAPEPLRAVLEAVLGPPRER